MASLSDSPAPRTHERPLLLGSVLWGPRFVDTFCRTALASLLAPDNIPACVGGGEREARFLIATDPADRPRIEARPEITALREFMAVDYLDLAKGGSSMVRMSAGHRLITARFAEAGALAGIVYPDSLYADGTLAWAKRAIDAGARLATVACPRACVDDLLDALELERSGAALSVEAATLGRRALRHPHDELLRCFWPRSTFGDRPAVCAWPVPAAADPPSALLLYSLCWAPLLLDFSALAGHDAGSLEGWTIDGDYLYRNVGEGRDGTVAVPAAGDPALIVSLSNPDQGITGLRRHPLLALPVAGHFFRRAMMRHWLNDPAIDPLKRVLFRRPVVWGEAPADVLAPVRQDAERALASVEAPPGAFDRVVYALVRVRPRLAARLWFLLSWPISKLPGRFRHGLRRTLRRPR